MGGIGIGDASWTVDVFAVCLNDRQRIAALDVRTKADGVVAGVHRRDLIDGGPGVTASILYHGGDAWTERCLPDGRTVSGDYGLRS